MFLVLASEVFFTRVAERELLQQDARGYAADAAAIEAAYEDGQGALDAMDDALDLVESMEDRLGIDSATLLNAAGAAISAPRDTDLGPDLPSKPDRNTVAASAADVKTSELEDGFRFLVPVHIRGEQFWLQVDADGTVLRTRISALSNEALAFSMVSLLIGIGLFYLLAGRTFARHHRLAVSRATRDSLTGLGNHGAFQSELERAVAVASRRGDVTALALIDLDDFKFTNDRFGHRKGDEVLIQVARALELGRPEDRAFRIGGDEFAVVMPGGSAAGARAGLDRRLAAAQQSNASTSFSVGVALTVAGADTDALVLWEQADAALYEGKRSGGGEVVMFGDVEELLSIVTPAKIRALRSFLEEPRLEIVFQPIWDLQDGRVLGLEALTRPWDGYEFEGPANMFAVADKIGRAHELDAICRAAAFARADEIPTGVLLFLNVHPQSLAHGDLAGDRLLRSVAAAGLHPSQVVLEITERTEARLAPVIADAIRLRSLGFRLALDDVGAGNAGLEMLRELPVDFVKIDKAIVAAATSDTNAQAVLFAIIAYARGAGAYVIAEGIETEEMLSFVREPERFLDNVDDASIKGGQGYLLGLPSADISGLTTSPQVKTHWLAGRRQVHTANSVARASRQAPPKARL